MFNTKELLPVDFLSHASKYSGNEIVIPQRFNSLRLSDACMRQSASSAI